MAKKDKHSKRLMVRSAQGRHHFQRGIVTAAFLQRGASMEDALELSAQVKAELGEKDEVDAHQITELIDTLIKRVDLEPAHEVTRSTLRSVRVRSSGGSLPFSKGVLLRQLLTTGLDIEHAYELVGQVAVYLDSLHVTEVETEQVEEEVARLLREVYGETFARRYELISYARQERRPIIILIGGATGTGKSTIATELAARLGITMVTGTDLIRATMRTVLSPNVVPGLHDHSFRAMGDAGEIVSNARQRVLAGFHQQAAQVGVGVRAVVRRAITENTHLIIEGTHLMPPFEQYLPPGADALVVGLVLTVPSEQQHRKRFPRRARSAPGRPAAPYLDAFQSVRWIHDDLAQLAEDDDGIVITNEVLARTLTAVTSYLAEALPVRRPSANGVTRGQGGAPQAPTLFLVMDGLSDEPNAALGDRTPLAAAHIPTLRTLAATGALGELRTGNGERAPGTDEGLVALLGTQEQAWTSPGRGVLEALGAGVPLPTAGVMLRGNLATVYDNGLLVDRRAGRIRDGTADLLEGLRDVPLGNGIVGHIYPGHEHRVVVVLQGAGLSDQISNTDPGSDATVQKRLICHATDGSDAAMRTARALNELLSAAANHLELHPHNESRRDHGLHPANCIITRGAASVSRLPKPNLDAESVVVVSGCATVLGVGRALGYAVATNPLMTGNLDTDLDYKFETAGELLDGYRMVVVHVKGTDIAAHDRRPIEKRDFIEAIDTALGEFLKDREGLRVVVSADHGTSSRTGNHLSAPVPLLVSTWQGEGEEAAFDEDAAAHGVLGTLTPKEFSELLRAPSVADDDPA